MTQYIFSKGSIHVNRDVNLKPSKRKHPLKTTVLLVVYYDEQPKEQTTDEPKQSKQ